VSLFHQRSDLFPYFSSSIGVSRENDEGAMVKRKGILVTSAFISRLAFQEMTSSPVFSTAKNSAGFWRAECELLGMWNNERELEWCSRARLLKNWTQVGAHKLRRLTRVCVVSYPVFCGGASNFRIRAISCRFRKHFPRRP